MDMTKSPIMAESAIVVHFDGDPLFLNFWLTLYDRYIRGEVETVYLSFAANREILPENIIKYDLDRIAKYKEIQVFDHKRWIIPELGNQSVLPQVSARKIGLIESDGFIFERGFVSRCFSYLDKFDVVAPEWDLIPYGYIRGDLKVKGFMRCFMFARQEIFAKTDYNFMPKSIPAGFKLPFVDHVVDRPFDLDCFGWMSIQIACQQKNMYIMPNNIATPDNIMKSEIYQNNPYIHVRQMMSSALGINNRDLWDENIKIDTIIRMFDEGYAGGPSEFTYTKAIAFRLLFWDVMKNKADLGAFADNYRERIEMMIDIMGLERSRIHEIKGYYKGIMRL